MAFIKSNGKAMTKKDIAFMKSLYENLFYVYSRELANLWLDNGKSKFYEKARMAFDVSSQVFLARFDEAAASGNKVKIESFYDQQMKIMYENISQTVSRKSAFWRGFCSGFFNPFIERYEQKAPVKDTLKGLEISMGSFKLTDKAFAGIEKIAEYDPYSQKTDALMEARKANSNTYDSNRGENTEAVRDANFGFYSATEQARSSASEFRARKTVSAGDIFNAFSSINTLLRLDAERGGNVRVQTVEAGKIVSITSVSIPEQAFRLMDVLADNINKIKQTQDPLVQKSQAIQLASFAYQMSVSEHIFDDGNGRSCRLLADTILGTFGLPPHTPNIAQINTGASIGNPLDFKVGAKLFLKGVTISNELINMEKEVGPERLADSAKSYLKKNGVELRVPGDVSPREAISLAIQARENKFAMVEALNDFIGADHIGANNSGEYTAVINTAKATLKTIYEKPLNSADSLKAIKNLQKSLNNYETHCKRKKRNDATRKARVKAAFRLGTAAFYASEIGEFVNGLRKKEIAEKNKELQNKVLDKAVSSNDAIGNLAKYIVTKIVAEDIKDSHPKLYVEDYNKLLKMDKTLLDKITGDPDLNQAMKDMAEKNKFEGKQPKEMIDVVADRYISRKKIEVAKKVKEAVSAGKKIETPKYSILE